LPGSKAALPAYGEVHRQVVPEVVLRVDRAVQAFFRRAPAGETAGYPRFQGRHRSHSFTYPQYENGARLDNGFLVLSKLGRVAVRWSRPLEGTPKTVTLSQEADGWYASISCTEVPAHPLPRTGRETGRDVGLQVFLITAELPPMGTWSSIRATPTQRKSGSPKRVNG
jgi:putative transposase